MIVEDWQIDFEWLRVRHYVKEAMHKDALPDMNAILFLVGMRELGQFRTEWTKEEKQDLMHIAICTLLSDEGYFTFKGLDADGWPHFEQARGLTIEGVKAQEQMLKEKVIHYFQNHNLISHHEAES